MVANDWAMKAAEKWAKKARYEAGMYLLIYTGSGPGTRVGSRAQGEAAPAATTVSCHAPSRVGSSMMSPAASRPRSGCSHLAEAQTRITNAAGVVALDDLDKSVVDLHVTQSHRIGCDSCWSDGAWGARVVRVSKKSGE